MKLLCDTNVLVDVIGQRKPFFKTSSLALNYCEDESVIGYVADTTLTTLFYIVHKITRNNDTAYQALDATLRIFNVAHASDASVKKALALRHRDFEDAFLACIAGEYGCDYVLTRNVKDFHGYAVEAITPNDFVKQML